MHCIYIALSMHFYCIYIAHCNYFAYYCRMKTLGRIIFYACYFTFVMYLGVAILVRKAFRDISLLRSMIKADKKYSGHLRKVYMKNLMHIALVGGCNILIWYFTLWFAFNSLKSEYLVSLVAMFICSMLIMCASVIAAITMYRSYKKL